MAGLPRPPRAAADPGGFPRAPPCAGGSATPCPAAVSLAQADPALCWPGLSVGSRVQSRGRSWARGGWQVPGLCSHGCAPFPMPQRTPLRCPHWTPTFTARLQPCSLSPSLCFPSGPQASLPCPVHASHLPGQAESCGGARTSRESHIHPSPVPQSLRSLTPHASSARMASDPPLLSFPALPPRRPSALRGELPAHLSS